MTGSFVEGGAADVTGKPPGPRPSTRASRLAGRLGKGGRASLWGLAFKVCGAGLLLALHVLLARASSPAQYGAYMFAFTFASLSAILVQSGLGQVSLRFASIHVAESDGGSLRSLRRFVVKRLWAASVLVCALCAVAALVLTAVRPGLDRDALLWSVALVPLVAAMTVNEQTMRATGSVGLSLFPTQIAMPSVFMAVVLAGMSLGDGTVTSTTMVISHVGVAFAVVCGQAVWVRRRVQRLPVDPSKAGQSSDSEQWALMNARSFRVLVFNAVLAKSDLLMLGVLAGAGASGAYAVCLKIGGLISFIQISINHALSPRIAVAWKRGDHEHLQALVSRSTAIMFTVECVLAVVIVLLAGPLLGLFGESYRVEIWALWIIVASYVYVAYAGIVNSLLNLSGQQRQMQYVYAGACITNIALNLIVIPVYGVTGAAATTLVTTVGLRYALVRCVRTQVGIDPMFRVAALRALSAR